MRFLERPSSWYDPPDEPSDAEYDACYDAWVEHLEEYCERCVWQPDPADKDKPLETKGQPCATCADDPPQPYDDTWIQRWFDDRASWHPDA